MLYQRFERFDSFIYALISYGSFPAPRNTLVTVKHRFFVAFGEDDVTMSSMRYFENHVSYFVQKPKEVDPSKLNSLRQESVSIALKYIINNSLSK